MTLSESPEIFWLSLTLVLTGLLWVPYILQLIVQLGPLKAIWDPIGAHPHEADWALRAKKAHYNAVENLVIFAPLVLIVHLLDITSAVTSTAAMVYFFARLCHFVIYCCAIPVMRTLVFLVGFGCQAVFALRIFDMI